MGQLLVTVSKLNKRSEIPIDFSDKKSIIGVVQKGFRFEGTEETIVANPALGKWYKDRDDHFYWGGGLTVLDEPPSVSIKVKNLPVNLPSEYRVGVDISHHNSLPDWAALKTAGVSFVYLKTSEGVGTPDPKAKPNTETAKRLGFKIGYYHFCHPDTRNGGTVVSDANAEVDEALSRIAAITAPDLPMVLDLENENMPLSREDFLLWITTFIDRVIQKTGVEPMIYGAKVYLDSKLPSNHDLGKYRLWIPHYELYDAHKLRCPVGWNDWTMWQYTEHGSIGANGELDTNVLKDLSLF
jgi:GH25 family lysozyme M1 (1,4-beta-N-acetylmuramidase)